jgi:multidrug efflux pump subunit AcrA (membrane-fusion protein)
VRLTVILLLLVGVGCGAPVQESETAGGASTPVDVATVRVTALEEQLAAVGTVRARNEVVVAARLLSYVRSMPVREGDAVSAGQTLVTLDDRELRSAVESARASQSEAESAILVAEQGISAARSQLHLAELTHTRYADLLAQESVSQQEFDVAEARLASAKTALASAESGKKQAEAKRAQADAASVRAEVALGYAVITAPIAGVVTERMVDPGALASPGAPLLRIEQVGSYHLEVSAPESRRHRLGVGQVVPLEIDALKEQGRLEGPITEIVPAVDARSRTFTVKVALPDASEVRSGQYGRAFLPGDTREALLVPGSAVVERGQLRFVTVVQDGHARRRAVTLGERRDSHYEALSGLQSGDRVILDPAGIRDGDAVSPRELTP